MDICMLPSAQGFGTDSLSDDQLVVYHALFWRRDIRREFVGRVLDRERLIHMLAAAHAAPSVSLSQPWSSHIIQDSACLRQFADHVAGRRARFAAKLEDERRETFSPIRIEGIMNPETGIVVTYDPTRGGKNILDRDAVDDIGLMSVALTTQSLWLTVTAKGLGVGWASSYHEDPLADFIGIKTPVCPVAQLCIGPVTYLAAERDLEKFSWREGLVLDEVAHWG